MVQILTKCHYRLLNLIHGYPNQAAAEADYGHVPIQNVMDFTGTSYDNLQTKDFNKYFANKELGSIQETPNTRPHMNAGIRGSVEGVTGLNMDEGFGPEFIGGLHGEVGYGYQPGFYASAGTKASLALGTKFHNKLKPTKKISKSPHSSDSSEEFEAALLLNETESK